MYLKQVVIYKTKLTKLQEKKLKRLLSFEQLKINGKIVIQTKLDVDYKKTREDIKDIMNCLDGEINCTYKSF